MCDTAACTLTHCEIIDQNFRLIVDTLKSSSSRFKYANKREFHAIPSWNELCKVKYNDARYALN